LNPGPSNSAPYTRNDQGIVTPLIRNCWKITASYCNPERTSFKYRVDHFVYVDESCRRSRRKIHLESSARDEKITVLRAFIDGYADGLFAALSFLNRSKWPSYYACILSAAPTCRHKRDPVGQLEFERGSICSFLAKDRPIHKLIRIGLSRCYGSPIARNAQGDGRLIEDPVCRRQGLLASS
jgi:hypothetical protein